MSLEGGVKLRRFDFRSKLLEVGEGFLRFGFARFVLLRDEGGDLVLNRVGLLRQVNAGLRDGDFGHAGDGIVEFGDRVVDVTNRRLIEFGGVTERVAIVRESEGVISLSGGFVGFLNVEVPGAFTLGDTGYGGLHLSYGV